MFRSRGENARSVFVLLFLNVAFFILQTQDGEKYRRLFAFDAAAVGAGELWRVVTWQFTQTGSGFMQALSLFITLLLLYMMGSAVEEEWGTRHFVALFVLSTAGSAGVAAFLGISLLNSYFVYFTLLFVYAAAFPGQTFYLFGLVPVPVRLLAIFSLGVLLYGVFSGGLANVAALAGSALAFAYYLSQRVPLIRPVAVDPTPVPAKQDPVGIHNAAKYAAIRRVLAVGSPEEVDLAMERFERDITPGVNICPPADFKPGDADGYCLRCEGFAECSVRYLRQNRANIARTAP